MKFGFFLWEEEYRAIRLQIRRAAIDTFSLSKILKFTAASTQKSEVKAVEHREEVRQFERHRQRKDLEERIKLLRKGQDARPLFNFKQEMQQLYNEIAEKQEKITDELAQLLRHHDLANVRPEQSRQDGHRITERDQEIDSEDDDQSHSFITDSELSQPQVDISKLGVEEINSKLFKLGKFLGWKAGDHLQFLQILTKHKNNASEGFISEVSKKLALPVNEIIEHVERLEFKNSLQARKKDIIREHKERKVIQKKAEEQLQTRRKEQAQARSRQKSMQNRKVSMQKKMKIEAYRKQNPRKGQLIPKR